MLRQSLRKLFVNSVSLFLLISCFFIIMVSQPAGINVILGQSRQKTIIYSPSRNQPLLLEKINTAGNVVDFNADPDSKKYIDGDDDWIKGLAITLKNTSGKNIVYIEVLMKFPETVPGEPITFPLTYGRFPKEPSDRDYSTTLLKPGDEATMTLTDDAYNNLQALLNSKSISQVNSVHLIPYVVAVEDDFLWTGGLMMKRDPNNPEQWNNIDNR